ncbi:peptidoglycan D,D-transpeptidase FtsI family protein [Corynebacterium otitidis]|uniref:Cell division protein n=1 Tax=Corynebacterium otitidis ATCC 51513 TaxID=883169 RepID=I7IWJ8_9CORY|nr:penicillin-binding protein 2 [Corynebacterium otitidis]EJZ82769.1 hypothetical protein HMPREF9719_00261 [Corynebacterium otitidis ATCC 51513]KKO83202.1 cell division protein FtsI [Corynebacterium otitidis]CCI83008.1 Cell division protein [Corynebacterium otitidis ATCC 51513]
MDRWSSEPDQRSGQGRAGGVLRRRMGVVALAFGVLAALLIGRLAWVQIVWGPDLAAKAEEQRARIITEPARRGEIVDAAGHPLAYTMQARTLTISPVLLRKELREANYLDMQTEGEDEGLSEDEVAAELDKRVEAHIDEMATQLPELIGPDGAQGEDGEPADINPRELKAKFHADTDYEVLVRNVDPDVAERVTDEFPRIAADHQDIRHYPNGPVAENVLGKVSRDGEGQFGIEAARDQLLTGANGRTTVDVSVNGQEIPGTKRNQVDAEPGAGLKLSLDLDLQTYVQQKIESAVENSGAQSGEAVVLDAHTGRVLAMATDNTIDPNRPLEPQLEAGKTFENPVVSSPIEPGSVAKIITAAAAIEEGETTPDEVHTVPGQIEMDGLTVRDAWEHGDVNYTTTGIFGKSSNVGTLMIAQRLGEERYNDYLQRFGLGQTTGIELPNESAGLLPELEDWSNGTFANLPIGQGMSWTTLQMASVFQTLANGGERVEPRIVDEVTGPDGEPEELPEPHTTRVLSPETARTVVEMFRSVTQSDPQGRQQGTGADAAVEGYQTSGKTGTAQKVDPDTGAYSNSSNWITFAGIAPADDPRYVIAVTLDDPKSGVEDDGSGGQSAAPVFRDIASWVLNRNDVPLSPPPEGKLILEQ